MGGILQQYYGTPRKYVTEQLMAGNNVILEIEVQGALQVKKIYPEGVLIFMVPPNLEELGNRLTKRGTEDKGNHQQTTAPRIGGDGTGRGIRLSGHQ